jgi:hypothetical protein
MSGPDGLTRQLENTEENLFRLVATRLKGACFRAVACKFQELMAQFFHLVGTLSICQFDHGQKGGEPRVLSHRIRQALLKLAMP